MRTVLLIISVCCCIGVYGQTISYSDDYRKVKEGLYYSESRNFDFVGDTVFINPQTTVESINEGLRYISVNPRPIWLFRNSNPEASKDVAGYLKEGSYIELVHTEYRNVFEEKDGYQSVTFEVWHTILLNGTTYYIDCKPFIIRYAYPYKEQLFFMIYQYMGYDYQYDTGYPNNFKVVVTMNDNESMRIVFESGRLNFTNGDEFWDIKDGGMVVSQGPDGLDFNLIGLNETLSGTWNGTKIINMHTEIIPPGNKDYKKP